MIRRIIFDVYAENPFIIIAERIIAVFNFSISNGERDHSPLEDNLLADSPSVGVDHMELCH